MDTIHLSTVLEKHTQNLDGKVALITGTTSGTGYVCARELARLGAKIFLLNRDSLRSVDSLKKLKSEVTKGQFVSVTCDLQDFSSVRRAANFIKEKCDVVDILCNNAGIMAMPDEATKDGYDIQMQTNCLSHFLLTRNLFHLLRKSDDARIVNHSSQARLGGPLKAEYFGKNGGNLGGDGSEEEVAAFGGPRWERYHQTKLGNAAFTYGLHNRLEAANITNVKSLLAHPGLAVTSLATTTASTGGMDLDTPFMKQAQSAEDGATGIIRACADKDAVSGNFYGPKEWTGFPELLPPEDLLLDPKNIEINWTGCEAAVGKFRFEIPE